MQDEGLTVVHLELKYCELCGGLWLRMRGSGQAHCEPCGEKWSAFAWDERQPRLPKELVRDTDGCS